MTKKYRAIILLSLFTLILPACGQRVTLQPDKFGCLPPPMFKLADVNFKIAELTANEVATSGIDMRVITRLASLASQIAHDALAKDYLRCLAIHRDRYTPQQAVYVVDDFMAFMQTHPTAEEFLRWKRDNPFPIEKRETSPHSKVTIPIISPSSNPDGSITVSITCSIPGAIIHYTTDGSEPTENSNIYTRPLILTKSTTIKAKAFKDGDGWTPSDTASAEYTPKSKPNLTRNINFFIGPKYLDSDNWKPLNKQMEWGGEADLKLKNLPISFVLAWLTSKKETTRYDQGEGNIDIRGKTEEWQIGIKKHFYPSMFWDRLKVSPFIEGGAAYIIAEEEKANPEGITKSDSDSAIGPWIGGGAYWAFYNPFHLGLELRYSFAKLNVFDLDVNAGGLHLDGIVGVHW